MNRAVIIDELERIRQKNNGLLRPETVIREANNPENPLHQYFDWNNNEAAQKWRLEQARRLIRVAVTVIHPEKEEPVRTYVSLVEDRRKGNGYRATVDVLSDTEKREHLLQQALRELATFRKKYAVLTELAEVFAVADSILEKGMPEFPVVGLEGASGSAVETTI